MPLPPHRLGLPWYKDAANAALRALGRLIFGPMWVVEADHGDWKEVIGGTYGTRGEAEREAGRLSAVADGLVIRVRRQTEADKMALARMPLAWKQPMTPLNQRVRPPVQQHEDEKPDSGVIYRKG